MIRQPGSSRTEISGEASEWFVLLRQKDVPRKLRVEFANWLLESPVHVKEYLAIAQTWGALAAVDPEGRIELEPNTSQEEIVTSIARGKLARGTSSLTGNMGTRRNTLTVAASIAFFAIFFILPFVAWNKSGPTHYSTRLGEQRSIVLEDGSILELNTLTNVTVNYTESERRIELLNGEAIFNVQHDADRPFLVDSGAALVRVTGTTFAIRRKPSATSVAVIEGNVAVVRNDTDEAETLARNGSIQTDIGDGNAVMLKAGQIATVDSVVSPITTRQVESIESVTAWRERRLVFDARPINAIVEEFNRYNANRIIVDDRRLETLRFSGVFDSNDPDSFLEFLESTSDVDVLRRRDGTRVIVSRRDSKN